MNVLDDLNTKRQQVLAVAAKHGAVNVAVFGSVARREEGPASDIDLLVDVSQKTSPWFPGGLVAELEELTGRKVQVLTRRSLSPFIRDAVLREAQSL